MTEALRAGSSRFRARGIVLAIYLGAFLLAAGAVALLMPNHHPLWQAAAWDLLATLLVFAGSLALRNASIYDPYWSVAPIAIVAAWLVVPTGEGWVLLRSALVAGLIFIWGLRLTGNWLRRWQGLDDEDWRYDMLRARHGTRYLWVNLFGIHLFPTVLVFLALLPAWAALNESRQGFNALDGLAAVVMLVSILLETKADQQLAAFRRSKQPGELLTSGVWGRCRHPNYLGELGVWWGLWLFALAANPGWWWTGIGAAAMTALFLGISIPMMDKRMLARYPAYAAHLERVPALWPFGRSRRRG